MKLVAPSSHENNGKITIKPKFILDDFDEERTYLRLSKPKKNPLFNNKLVSKSPN